MIISRGVAWLTLCLTASLPIVVDPAEARVTRIDITRREPFAGGIPFGASGPYEKLVGTAHLEVDPTDPRNAVIQDLDKAPRNANGRVELSTDLYLLKPSDVGRGNGKIFFEVNNRGNKISLVLMNDTPPDANNNDPTTPTDAGNGFLMRQGYVIAWAGWQGDLTPGNNRLRINLPVVTAAGAAITGPVAEQYDVSRHIPVTGAVSLVLSGTAPFDPYETASTNNATAALTVRDHVGSPETLIAPDRWAFATCARNPTTGMVENVVPSPKHICYFDGFDPNKLYQLVYTGRNPKPMALGYAATRDVVSFLRYAAADDAGTPNPLGPGITNAYCMGISSSGMYVRDYVYLGFNADEHGRPVCDGLFAHIPGAFRLHLNTRFTQPDIYSRQDLWAGLYPMATFPFGYGVTTDPITGRTDGILKRPATDPRIIQTDTSTEFWQFHASLVTHDALGRPLSLPDTARYYLLSSAQHFATAGAAPARGICEQLSNPLHAGVFMRALLVAMDGWVIRGTPPPASRYPRVTDRTLVAPARATTGFPAIPGVTYTGQLNTLMLRDYGPGFGPTGGVISILPPVPIPGTEHTILVPMVDRDGNDVAGLRRPDDVETPVATLTGWNHRRAGFRAPDLCGLTGLSVPFARTRAERLAAGDPRKSLEERYTFHERYVKRVKHAARELMEERLLLQEDVDRIVQAAAASTLLPAQPPDDDDDDDGDDDDEDDD
jgi:hypothetical protein